MIQRHGVLYSEEQGYNADCAISIAQKITDDFIANHDPNTERCWIAERTGDAKFLGCIMLVKDKSSDQDTECAKLRLLLVQPAARGSGLGRDLVRQCTLFAREAGYKRIRLWTHAGLTAARRLYEREGYTLVGKEVDESFGVKVTAESWEMVL